MEGGDVEGVRVGGGECGKGVSAWGGCGVCGMCVSV